MTTAIFIGSVDKSDHLFAVSTILARLQRKVLLIDGTREQWSAYRIAGPAPSMKLMNWNGFDVLTGCSNWMDAFRTLEREHEAAPGYDHVLVDTDSAAFFAPAQWAEADCRFLCQTAERYHIAKNKEWLAAFQRKQEGEPLAFIPVLFRSVEPESELAFVKDLYHSEFGQRWSEAGVVIPEDERNWAAKMEQEHGGTLRLQAYARGTKRAWRQLLEQIAGPLGDREWRRCLKAKTKGR
ncbi:MAG: carbon monoxide dehydrogenase maturation protein [Paenibacillus dendritiformis]|uniref:carbon monoxide dehydrogenase maturation protein n=1 Tax=Paenibacillus dendritiformis TaxID=130049 RepID=UPI00143D234B|nr:carbon monoxide dehydrogenase maturation protein [Paenibacillus dendritiformis]MDU5140717.1 carbon monoxide dehydrogenase maturation protein [Paenibacillus dendritiformis]NKI22988.1 carbon monoxide dehydrogenase maturation protein [Paenibacillus dendritiformis]NRF97714.1 carbon monoxide dehydrogenase maturation protein [Paenibacillus dendritiformis]